MAKPRARPRCCHADRPLLTSGRSGAPHLCRRSSLAKGSGRAGAGAPVRFCAGLLLPRRHAVDDQAGLSSESSLDVGSEWRRRNVGQFRGHRAFDGNQHRSLCPDRSGAVSAGRARNAVEGSCPRLAACPHKFAELVCYRHRTARVAAFAMCGLRPTAKTATHVCLDTFCPTRLHSSPDAAFRRMGRSRQHLTLNPGGSREDPQLPEICRRFRHRSHASLDPGIRTTPDRFLEHGLC